jgi:SAM-dependent methyltransferase
VFSDPKTHRRTSAAALWEEKSREFGFLCVDDFVGDIFRARALATAFETGLIDALIQSKSLSYNALMKQGNGDTRGRRLLLELLVQNRVVDHREEKITLTESFLHALEYRDLLELKISLANGAAHDFLNHFSELVFRPHRFFRKAEVCRLFAYDRCFSRSEGNYEATKRWMRITTTLTKYEAHACMKYHDFGRYRSILDIGGNSGEFVLQICTKYPLMQAVVFDLPLVCEIGREHLHSKREGGRISFVEGNALTDDLPKGFDLIIFKSMLHDWPEREAVQFINRASQSLAPGGTLLIFERGPIAVGEGEISYSIMPFLPFLHSFRSPDIYDKILRANGYRNIDVENIHLDSPFFILTARKIE